MKEALMDSTLAKAHRDSYTAHMVLRRAKAAGDSPNVLDDLEAYAEEAAARFHKALAVRLLAQAMNLREGGV